jgi:osmotically-inducible protein OsmY
MPTRRSNERSVGSAGAMRIKVDTHDKGVATMNGTAKTQEEADRAVSIARNVEGVATAENNVATYN